LAIMTRGLPPCLISRHLAAQAVGGGAIGVGLAAALAAPDIGGLGTLLARDPAGMVGAVLLAATSAGFCASASFATGAFLLRERRGRGGGSLASKPARLGRRLRARYAELRARRGAEGGARRPPPRSHAAASSLT
jgi:hypothetical protein